MKYLTFSYDDGCRQDIKFIEILKRYSLKATFNLNSSTFGSRGHINHGGFDVCFDKVDADEVKSIYEGFEVASHGKCHRLFPKLSDAELDDEIYSDKAALEALTGIPIVGAAYPCGLFDDKIADRLRERGINYCRTIASTHRFDVPTDFNLWHPTCHDHDESASALADEFIKLETENDAIFYIWGHSFEFDKNDCDRWYAIEKLCEKLAGRDDIRYATNAEIFNEISKKDNTLP